MRTPVLALFLSLISFELLAVCNIQVGEEVYTNLQNTHLTGKVKSISAQKTVEVSIEMKAGKKLATPELKTFPCLELWKPSRLALSYVRHFDARSGKTYDGMPQKTFMHQLRGDYIQETKWEYIDGEPANRDYLSYVIYGSYAQALWECQTGAAEMSQLMQNYEMTFGPIRQRDINFADSQIGLEVSGIRTKFDYIMKYAISYEFNCKKQNNQSASALDQSNFQAELQCLPVYAMMLMPSIKNYFDACFDSYQRSFVDFNF